MKEMNPQVQEIQLILHSKERKKSTLSRVKLQLIKDKWKILKSSQGEETNHLHSSNN